MRQRPYVVIASCFVLLMVALQGVDAQTVGRAYLPIMRVSPAQYQITVTELTKEEWLERIACSRDAGFYPSTEAGLTVELPVGITHMYLRIVGRHAGSDGAVQAVSACTALFYPYVPDEYQIYVAVDPSSERFETIGNRVFTLEPGKVYKVKIVRVQ